MTVLLLAGCTAGTRAGTPSSKPAMAPSATSPHPSSGRPSSAGPTAGIYADYCDDPASCPTGGVPAMLRRPLRLPVMAAGRCPITPPRTVSTDFGPAAGPGPIYPIIATIGGPNGNFTFNYPPAPDSIFAGSEFSGGKVLWIAAPNYVGAVLIRGGQLNGPNPLKFSTGTSAPFSELQFPPGRTLSGSDHAWRSWPSETRLRAAGCYAWQLDGTNFSYTVTFRALITK